MTQLTFIKSKLTRGLTALCTCVLLVVSVFSFLFGVSNRLFPSEKISVNASAHKGTVIVIDPGHGGEDGGTQTDNGELEKDINLAIGCYLRDFFDFFGYETVMTRSEDKLIYNDNCSSQREKKVSDIKNRFAIMENNPDCIFLSIHQNHYEGKSSCGTQVFYSCNNEKSEELAEAIQKTIVGDIQKDNRRTVKKSGKEIYLLFHAQVPAVMVECGFLSNTDEAQKLLTKEYQKLMAFEIFKGSTSVE